METLETYRPKDILNQEVTKVDFYENESENSDE